MLDLTKPMMTRSGLKARLIFKEMYSHVFGPLVFAIAHEDGIERLGFRKIDGEYPMRGPLSMSQWDIVNIPTADDMVIVTIRNGMADVTKVPEGVFVKILDYDVDGSDDAPDLIFDELGKRCRYELHGSAGQYADLPFA
jgi:hypothetical protein